MKDLRLLVIKDYKKDMYAVPLLSECFKTKVTKVIHQNLDPDDNVAVIQTSNIFDYNASIKEMVNVTKSSQYEKTYSIKPINIANKQTRGYCGLYVSNDFIDIFNSKIRARVIKDKIAYSVELEDLKKRIYQEMCGLKDCIDKMKNILNPDDPRYDYLSFESLRLLNKQHNAYAECIEILKDRLLLVDFELSDIKKTVELSRECYSKDYFIDKS